MRQGILNELRKQERTINELCDHFKLTRNAIKHQLDRLRQEGFIGSKVRHEPGQVGKPSQYYFVLPKKEYELSKAYLPFLRAVLDSLQHQLTPDAFKKVLENVADYLPKPALDDDESALSRLQKAARIMDELGALTEIRQKSDRLELCSYSCPLAVLVQQHEPVCDAVANYFAQITQGNVIQQCENQKDRPFCHFLIRVLAVQSNS